MIKDSTKKNCDEPIEVKERIKIFRKIAIYTISIYSCILVYPILELMYKFLRKDRLKENSDMLIQMMKNGISSDDYKMNLRYVCLSRISEQLDFLIMALPPALTILYILTTETLNNALSRIRNAPKFIFSYIIDENTFGDQRYEYQLAVTIIFLLIPIVPLLVRNIFSYHISFRGIFIFLIELALIFIISQIGLHFLKFLVNRFTIRRLALISYTLAVFIILCIVYMPPGPLLREFLPAFCYDRGIEMPNMLLFGDRIEKYRQKYKFRMSFLSMGSFNAISYPINQGPDFPAIILLCGKKNSSFGGLRGLFLHEIGHMKLGNMRSILTLNCLGRLVICSFPLIIILCIHLAIYKIYRPLKYRNSSIIIPLILSTVPLTSFFLKPLSMLVYHSVAMIGKVYADKNAMGLGKGKALAMCFGVSSLICKADLYCGDFSYLTMCFFDEHPTLDYRIER